jgi:hypothetical protein
MNRILDASRRFFLALGRALSAAWSIALKWLSVPVNLCLAAIALFFLVSFGSWAIGDRFSTVLLYFPDSNGALHGETREVPRCFGAEKRAELIASELLLGPGNGSLVRAFEAGVQVQSAIYRKSRLFVDISPEAALAEPKALKAGIAAMDRSLVAALPGIKRISLTIGGKEPYIAGLEVEEGRKGAKKTGK